MKQSTEQVIAQWRAAVTRSNAATTAYEKANQAALDAETERRESEQAVVAACRKMLIALQYDGHENEAT